MASNTTVTLTSVPSTLAFSVNATCTPAATTVVIPAGSSSTIAHFNASAAGTYTVTAASNGFTSATQSASVIAAPTQLVFTTGVPNPLLAGACVLSTVQARRLGIAAPVAADTAVGLTETLVGTARYYSDAACTTVVTGVTILAGQTNADFYLKPLSGGSTTQTATAPFGSVNRTLTILPAVRRGICNFNAPSPQPDGSVVLDTFESCPIAPSQQTFGKTALFFQATTSSSNSATAMIRCRLSSTNSVSCNRSEGQSSANVHWQSLELPAGLRVERLSGSCQAPPFTLTLPAAQSVNPASTFLLASFNTPSGNVDDEDLITTQLTSATSVVVDFGTATTTCAGGSYDIQAVELTGVTMARGVEDAGIPAGAQSIAVAGLTASSLNTVLLSQVTVPSANQPICSVLVRGDLPTSSSLAFSRGAGFDGGCVTAPVLRVAWERIDFGSRARVQTRTVTLGATVSTLPVAIAPVDVTRTLVFASSQTAAGQSVGETNAAVNNLGEGNARFELSSSTNVNVIRQRSGGIAIFTFYVVEIEP